VSEPTGGEVALAERVCDWLGDCVFLYNCSLEPDDLLRAIAAQRATLVAKDDAR